ncbi:MAG: hypothetical protein R2771_16485 [Saprospiraceae bacterium]
MSKAVNDDDFKFIKDLLAQLGKTPFFKHHKPTPLDEAISLMWYLENILYTSISNVFNYIRESIFYDEPIQNEIFEIGFWLEVTEMGIHL